MSVIVFLPLLSGRVSGIGIEARPLPIPGNLVPHLDFAAAVGLVYAEAAEDRLDDTEAHRANAACEERGAALGLIIGLAGGIVVGWLAGPMFGDLASRPASVIGHAFIGAAVGLGVGSFAGMGRAQEAGLT